MSLTQTVDRICSLAALGPGASSLWELPYGVCWHSVEVDTFKNDSRGSTRVNKSSAAERGNKLLWRGAFPQNTDSSFSKQVEAFSSRPNLLLYERRVLNAKQPSTGEAVLQWGGERMIVIQWIIRQPKTAEKNKHRFLKRHLRFGLLKGSWAPCMQIWCFSDWGGARRYNYSCATATHLYKIRRLQTISLFITEIWIRSIWKLCTKTAHPVKKATTTTLFTDGFQLFDE